MAATCTFLQAATNNTDQTVKTFAAQNLGTAAPDRRIVVAIATMTTANAAITGVTVAGVTATVYQANFLNQYTRVAIAEVDLPAGTSGDIVITTGNNQVRTLIGVYRLTGVQGAAVFLSDYTAPLTITHAAGINGTPIIGVGISGPTGTTTWTNINEDADLGFGAEIGTASVASTINNTSSPIAVTGAFSANGFSVIGTAFWLPAPEVSSIIYEQAFKRPLGYPLIQPLVSPLKQ